MTTFAPQQDVEQRLQAIEEHTKTAWLEYSELLEGLSGREYEKTEPEAWEELQNTLTALATERNELVAAGATPSA